MVMIEQGDMLRVGGINYPVIVVSNNFFNQSGKVIACPIRVCVTWMIERGRVMRSHNRHKHTEQTE